MAGLRLIFLLGLAACAFLTFATGYWEADLTIPQREGTCIIDLPRSPAWNPPPLPTYGDFSRVFAPELPKEQPRGIIITRVFKLEWTLIDGSLYLWGLTIVTAIPYYAVRRGRRDRLLTIVEKIALGMSAAAITCIILWLIGGGWGPPLPLPLAFLGVVGGIVWGLLVPFPPKSY